MTPFEFGSRYAGGHEKQALNPFLAKLLAGGKNLGKGLAGVDNAAAGLVRAVGSGATGIGKLFGAAGDAAAPIGKGLFNASTSLAENKIKNQPVSDVLKMLGYTGRMAGRGIESSGGGAGLVGKGFDLLGQGLNRVSNVGYGVPTATAIGLGGAGSAAGVLQNPIRIAPQKDHIDVRSPVTVPPAIRDLFRKQEPLRRAKYTATGRRRA